MCGRSPAPWNRSSTTCSPTHCGSHPPGSVITLTKTPVGEDPRVPANVALHVIDQGPGMSESERRRAFDRFWRAADAHHDGTGLGLPIVQQLTRAGGGDITLDAAPGGGLDAVVRLEPADPRRPPSARRPYAAARARHDATPPAWMG
ncbi:sensor histidine kinase [Streptomyces rugosispiralis]|uniref:sensor histidine kinase n=1 Tax=Streptomyces rugosispiralis TaxID=2967341 RepID=UPI0027E57D6A|nr:HAMP domain-containing sensor histidine kinase [Streptomyces rugosispiralis]